MKSCYTFFKTNILDMIENTEKFLNQIGIWMFMDLDMLIYKERVFTKYLSQQTGLYVVCIYKQIYCLPRVHCFYIFHWYSLK